jgi:acetyl esterase/lipase
VSRSRWPLLIALSVLVTGCGAAASTASPSPSAATASTPSTVTYCTDGGRPLTLDVYEPSRGAAPHPLLVFVHGGSWAFGSSRLAEQSPLVQGVVAGVLGRGFAVASVNYRLAPRDPWPAQVIDVRCALRYLAANAARWQLDPRRFTAMGNSAGAQLVSLAALSAGQVPAWDTAQWAGASTSLTGVVDCWGPIDLLAPGWGSTAIEIGRVVFRVDLGNQDQVLREASPVTYVHAGARPFLVIQGLADTLVPPQQSVELRDRLVADGDTATLVEVANAGHELRPNAGGGAISPGVDVLTQQVIAFLASVTA